ncbi:RagB/SusD family nutrient uptake outer membrane protein [Hymenobacter sp. BT559]|uniref:RagB/SusD family nutrient uptake outer membrane protein n=1 Tax=Hymenobacter sp. BT559 TaxID=2795729 RepID=UPI0018EB01CD|nr:RagB/SusD family nutrient uptake outer membrane protein [Hymenobacter sp. BT559]MBJ6144904.1 RagB/SusD family nutrient uptake outer membrane protein [Hymenobacter sp. BT559]
MQTKFTRTLGMLALAAGLTALSTACTKDLDQVPDYSANAEVVYSDPAQIQQVLARLYATYAISGQTGPSGAPDISGIDEGFSNYIRVYWQLQEVTTDEAVLGWNDGNLPAINTMTWNADNEFVRATYDRIYYQIGLCNEFIRQTTDANLASRGITGATATTVKQYRSEARLLRAMSYWHVVDLFGGGPFATEADVLGTLPQYKTRAEIFAYVESELKALDGTDASNGGLLAPKAVYARADQAVCWTLLAKLYLNAQVYTGTARYTDAVTYANKVLAANYQLCTTPSAQYSAYQKLFLADNNTSEARNEIIFPIAFDGTRTRGYGGMTYLVHAAVGGTLSPATIGINSGWGGFRARQQFTSILTSNTTSTSDARRSILYTSGQRLNVDTLTAFRNGYLLPKYKNVTSTGVKGSDAAGDFPDTDFPMFRLADVKLMYAEAVLRGGTGGTAGTALDQVNEVRRRSGSANLSAVALNDILDERARELYWEGHRRTDLIRFGRYTTGYNWALKGGVNSGRDVDATRALFPIPNTDIVANPNLQGKQNPGY